MPMPAQEMSEIIERSNRQGGAITFTSSFAIAVGREVHRIVAGQPVRIYRSNPMVNLDLCPHGIFERRITFQAVLDGTCPPDAPIYDVTNWVVSELLSDRFFRRFKACHERGTLRDAYIQRCIRTIINKMRDPFSTRGYRNARAAVSGLVYGGELLASGVVSAATEEEALALVSQNTRLWHARHSVPGATMPETCPPDIAGEATPELTRRFFEVEIGWGRASLDIHEDSFFRDLIMENVNRRLDEPLMQYASRFASFLPRVLLPTLSGLVREYVKVCKEQRQHATEDIAHDEAIHALRSLLEQWRDAQDPTNQIGLDARNLASFLIEHLDDASHKAFEIKKRDININGLVKALINEGVPITNYRVKNALGRFVDFVKEQNWELEKYIV